MLVVMLSFRTLRMCRTWSMNELNRDVIQRTMGDRKAFNKAC